MQVPNHVVSLYVATCGQSGQGLGSDEKEIILLVYHVIESTSAQIIGHKQILVRPDGTFNKDGTISEAISPPSSLQLTNNNISTKSANNDAGSASSGLLHATHPTNATNATNAPNNIDNTQNNPNGLPSLLTTEKDELTIAIAQSAAGKPLSEAIEEFDQYLRSLLHNNDQVIQNIQLVTDGQLPLRQSLHREACVKDITLPSYYNRFCDLRKEYVRYKSGDLSRALVPLNDIKKLLQLPSMPAPPQSVTEMLTDLNLTSTEDADYFMRESRDMVSIIQCLLKAGHKFHANEIVNLSLEPGICSINEEIDGNCIVRARGLPWQSSDQDIAKFFRGLNVAKGGVALCLSPLGRRNGEALIRFVSQEHRDMALKRHKHHIGNRYIEVYRATGEEFLAVAGGASNEAQAFLSKGAQVIIRMRGLPYDCTVKQVLDFFNAGDSPCEVLDGSEGVLFVKKPDGRATGDAFVLFANETDAPRALSRHRESIGQRYIELFRSTTAEVQQVLNRSLDPKTYEISQQPPLIAQLPTMPLSLLPQHFITSGTAKNCIRLRGLPYEALVENILHFLDDFAKHIIYQGVHMVINAQGQPSGEAFIQMDTEESARLCAQRKHNQFMVFGKKYRYIEVFQCSGNDMNLVLNGGLQTVGTATGLHHPHPHTHAHAHAAHTGGKQPPLLSPGMLTQSSSPSAQAISSSTQHRYPTHLSPHLPAHALSTLQSPMSAAVAALSQSPHSSHLSLAPPNVANAQSAMLASIMSAPTSVGPTATPTPHASALVPQSVQSNLAAAAAAAAAAANGLSNVHSSPLSMTPNNSLTAPPAFSFNLPPPQNPTASAASVHNSALFAQQQAQFIAQQTLLARQQAAAVAVAEQQHHHHQQQQQQQHQQQQQQQHQHQQQQQQQFYFAANLMNPILMQHTAAALNVPQGLTSPGAAGTQPQFFLMPRPSYFQTFPLGQAMPTAAAAAAAQAYHQFAGVAGVGGVPGVAGGTAVLPSAAGAATTASPHSSTKRSYEHAFQQDVNAASAAKRPVTRPSTGASVLSAPFVPHFPHFGPPPQRTYLTASGQRAAFSPSHPSAQHPAVAAAAAAAAFYQQPVFPIYWPYPSPPVSPTAFFSSPTHTAAAAGQPHQHMYPLDFIHTSTFGVATSPTLGTPGTGIILSPNKTAALQIAPPATKQFSLPTPTSPISVVNGTPVGSPLGEKDCKKLPVEPASLALLTIDTCDQITRNSNSSTARSAAIAATRPPSQIASKNHCVELYSTS